MTNSTVSNYHVSNRISGGGQPAHPHPDAIDAVIEQWQRQRPDLDLAAMGAFGRLIQLSRVWVAAIEKIFARHGLRSGEFDVPRPCAWAGPHHPLIPSELAAMLMMSRGRHRPTAWTA